MMTATKIDRHEESERDDLKRQIAAFHAESEFRTRDPSMWQWAKAYDWVEATFGKERTDVLRSLATLRPTLACDGAKKGAAPDTPPSNALASQSSDQRLHRTRAHRRGDLATTSPSDAPPLFPSSRSRAPFRLLADPDTQEGVAANDDADKERST